jgi:hypothetical protein
MTVFWGVTPCSLAERTVKLDIPGENRQRSNKFTNIAELQNSEAIPCLEFQLLASGDNNQVSALGSL